MNAIAKVPVRLTVEEFLLWADGVPGRWELVDGEPREMTPTVRTHGALQAALAGHLFEHLRTERPHCSVVTGPGVVPATMSAYNMRVPELAVTCAPYVAEEREVNGIVLIAEVLSPSNQADTWSNVWAFTTIETVREILVLRADRIEAELLRRDDDGRWPAEPARIAADAVLTLDSVGFRVPLADLYRTTRLATS